MRRVDTKYVTKISDVKTDDKLYISNDEQQIYNINITRCIEGKKDKIRFINPLKLLKNQCNFVSSPMVISLDINIHKFDPILFHFAGIAKNECVVK